MRQQARCCTREPRARRPAVGGLGVRPAVTRRSCPCCTCNGSCDPRDTVYVAHGKQSAQTQEHSHFSQTEHAQHQFDRRVPVAQLEDLSISFVQHGIGRWTAVAPRLVLLPRSRGICRFMLAAERH
jgi:hypothetical protein